jgi:hypothetical protein
MNTMGDWTFVAYASDAGWAGVIVRQYNALNAELKQAREERDEWKAVALELRDAR